MPTDPIQHTAVLMLKNNSFDRMLGCVMEFYPGLEGVDPAVPSRIQTILIRRTNLLSCPTRSERLRPIQTKTVTM